MGVAYYIVLDYRDPGFDYIVNGKFISKNSEFIDELATNNGLKLLDDYFSLNPVEARIMAEGMGADLEGIKFPDEKFFDCAEGSIWIQKLILAISHSDNKYKVDIIDDLKGCGDVLNRAQKIGAKWHFSIDI